MEKFEGQVECLEENTEKFITFTVQIKKENKNGMTVTYKIKFIDNIRFMASSLSSLPDNFVEGLHKGKCEKCKSGLEYATV